VIVCRKDGRVQVKDTNDLGMFVGFEPDISRFVHEFKVALDSGDTMVLYTDGVTEAVNGKDEEFGLKRLCAAVGELHQLPANAILEGVLTRLRAHVGKTRVYDDASLMVVKQR
jgi:phosphoserine phosphatase RsbU/P